MNTSTPVTVNTILDLFVEKSLHTRCASTQREHMRHIARLRAHFGERVASEIRPKDFGPFLDVRKGQCNRVRTLAVLSAAFTDAVSRWYVLERNILRDVKRPRFPPRDRLILDSEFEGCKAIAGKRMQLAMMLALLTGQRQGDIIAFKWSDIRDDALHVQQAKTGKRLAIEISGDLERVLDQCWLLEGGGKDGNIYVLPTKFGRPYTSLGFRAYWQKTQRRWIKGGGAPFHFHDIRALAATKCATPELAQRLLGHTSISMTLRVYRRGIERVQPLSWQS